MDVTSFFSKTNHSFESKKPYEQVILLLHRHWFVLAVQLFGFLLFGIIPIIASFFLSGVWFRFGASVFYLLWWFGLFYSITMYLLDVWIVTDHRVIDSEQHGFFNRTVAELGLYRIQDISVKVTGILPTFFDFGSIEIQTAGAKEKFFFQQIPHPGHVKDVVVEAHNNFIRVHPDDIEVHERP